MTKEECMEALSKHADIKPVITSTGKLLTLAYFACNNGIKDSVFWIILE